MRKTMLVLGILSLLWLWSATAHADLVSGSTGALGVFNPTANTVVTLPSDGVLNYTTVNIPAGVTITFTKNAANTPVHMLATGDVVIAGTINVNGTNASSNNIGFGGPGGFNGGYGGGTSIAGGNGAGPGGGKVLTSTGGGGGFGSNGTRGYSASSGGAGGTAYGNPRLLPLIGGSGGGGGAGTTTSSAYSGGGGGGAIVIASNTQISVTGAIYANGGNSLGNNYSDPYAGGGGSGGAIKLISNTISGNGTIEAAGGTGSQSWGGGGAGRIRIEAVSNTRTSSTDPPYTYGSPTTVFPANPPSLNITSIGGTNVPASPTGAYNQPDITLPSNTINPITVNVSATNIPLPNDVTITVIPQYSDATATNASAALSGTNSASTASANVNLSTTYANVITAQVTFTVVAMYYNGEEIDKVRVSATLGGKSETTYITKSGKEVKGELVAALAEK